MAREFNYPQMMRSYMHKAMRQMIHDVLARVAKSGLPGNHHFYITFETGHPGVDMSASLRDRYPEEMMIVMQEWFADLAVMNDRFSVTLNFGNVPEPIVIPFDAIKTFVDPSVEFGLRFEEHEEADASGAELYDAEPEPSREGPKRGGERRGEAEVVSLDKFRKH